MYKFLFILLAALGFSTSCSHSQKDMYGTPTCDYKVKGRVTDTEGNAIIGISVTLHNNNQSSSFVSTTTTKNGVFETKLLSTSEHDYHLVTFKDVDGKYNGGEFNSQTLDLNTNFTRTKVKDGEGWYQGEFEYSADVKLTKK